jgi:hypothetical protein
MTSEIQLKKTVLCNMGGNYHNRLKVNYYFIIGKQVLIEDTINDHAKPVMHLGS